MLRRDGRMGVQSHRQRGGERARSARAVALCLFTGLALAACGTDHKPPVASSADLPAPVLAASPAEPAATPVQTANVATSDIAEPDGVPPGPSFESAEPADPGEVMGLARGEVEALLGEPGLVRRDAPAEVWQYQSGGCVLDVFLYEASADYEVVYLEARTGKALVAATANCLGAVLDQRRKTPMS